MHIHSYTHIRIADGKDHRNHQCYIKSISLIRVRVKSWGLRLGVRVESYDEDRGLRIGLGLALGLALALGLVLKGKLFDGLYLI